MQFTYKEDFVYISYIERSMSTVYAINLENNLLKNIYSISDDAMIDDAFVEIVEYKDEVFLVSPRGLYVIEGTSTRMLFEYKDMFGDQYTDYYSALYTVGDDLIYENQSDIYIYRNNNFIPTTDFQPQREEGFQFISMNLNYYKLLIENREVIELYDTLGEVEIRQYNS